MSLCLNLCYVFHLYSIALLGVLGATGACKQPRLSSYLTRVNLIDPDTTLRAIGKRAHPLHAMTSFSAQCVVVSIIGYVFQPNSVASPTVDVVTRPISLVATQTKLVFPSKIEWLLLLLLIGVFGFIAQVGCISTFPSKSPLIDQFLINRSFSRWDCSEKPQAGDR